MARDIHLRFEKVLDGIVDRWRGESVRSRIMSDLSGSIFRSLNLVKLVIRRSALWQLLLSL
jgi:hypothetical protein